MPIPVPDTREAPPSLRARQLLCRPGRFDSWDETAPRAAAHQEYWADTWRCSRSLRATVKVEVIRSNPTIETRRPLGQRGKLPLIAPLVSGSTWQSFVEVEIRGLFFASVHVCRWATAEGQTCPYHITHQKNNNNQQTIHTNIDWESQDSADDSNLFAEDVAQLDLDFLPAVHIITFSSVSPQREAV